jgi:type IV pilus assembly protein PilX
MNKIAYQRGQALIVGLILLAILTLVGTSAMQVNLSQDRMTAQSSDYNIAFGGAEAALRVAEQAIESGDLTRFTADLLPAAADDRGFTRSYWLGFESGSPFEGTWTEISGIHASMASGVEVSNQPRYAAEFVRALPGVGAEDSPAGGGSPGALSVDRPLLFRITAVGTGGAQETRSVLQSTYTRLSD